ncbi:regulatory protein [Vibrio diazotrophicus]|jgi:regulatory protein|uniref:Regulatory protein RecX n=1 Tax=Vibrio diazotrophicus TaxID=685 RepID=A0A329EFQ2_VIBDI|nr:recombination regulator RecX [Vibrio diazotrophicus]RAS69399.1 regulatory protein [Vibrio diazotrophicus]
MYSSPNKMSCKERALYLLTRRDHGEFELWQKLLLKGFEEEEVQQAVIYCKEQGYLDDQRFARSQVRQHIAKGHGERRIRQELQQKRVENDVVNSAIEQEEVDWFELAKQTAEKKFKHVMTQDQKEYAKRVRFLQYRGFNFDQINYALSIDEEGGN